MAQVVTRAIMWLLIIAIVWYFAQQWKTGAPSEEEHETMMDAARHYQNYKMQMDQAGGKLESDIPQVK